MAVRWKSGEKAEGFDGGLTGPASAIWCPIERRLEVRTIAGDTGVILVVYPRDSVVSGKYPITLPLPFPASPIRPGAVLALRVVIPSAVIGFRADAGDLILARNGGKITGQFSAGMTQPGQSTRVATAGKFSRIPLEEGGDRCRPPR